jgi:hypothetical protein
VFFASCFVVQELLAIQQNGAKSIAFFGTRNMGFLHQQLVEILSYAMVLTGNHIFTSGGLGTNAAVIRGALRAERPDLLTVILPQSLEMQPEELHELLQQVEDLQCMSENDSMKLFDASRCDVVSAFMLHQLQWRRRASHISAPGGAGCSPLQMAYMALMYTVLNDLPVALMTVYWAHFQR